jgi:hypothetical protein
MLGLNEHSMQEGIFSIADKANFYRVVGVYWFFKEPGKADDVAQKYSLQLQDESHYHGFIDLEQKLGKGAYLDIGLIPMPSDKKSTLIVNGAPSIRVVDTAIDLLVMMGHDLDITKQSKNHGAHSGKQSHDFGSKIYKIYIDHFGYKR